ncbi:IMC sub-compartment ISP3, putative [Babesia ovis]|uniref:IMC sub-compartment ISP3, putative n=1 Tax=Babesia ovis TaxID=5869 RepID=A0A9W5WVR0_BABOV|nr:IMC sub-compartment ISP3, putative [Babesia ovis]
MGNQPSSVCCDAISDANAMLERHKELTPEEEIDFMNNMVNGCDTQIVFADGSSMPCTVLYDLAEDCLHLLVDEKKRVVPLRDVEEILGIDSVAGLSNVDKSLIIDPHIVAFRLLSTKKAILLRFEEIKDSQGFYHFLKEIIQENGETTHQSVPSSPPPEDETPSHTIIF